jgi:hypothetical protein
MRPLNSRYRVNTPTAENDDDSLEQDSPDRLARYADAWRPVRDAGEPRVPSYGNPPRRDRPNQQLHWGLLGAAAAAGFFIALFGPCRSIDPEREAKLANLQSELEIARDRATQLESELSAAHESGGKPDAPVRRASEREPQAEPPAEAQTEREPQAEQQTEHEPQAAPAPKREGRKELTPQEVLRHQEQRQEPVANPEAAKETDPPAATTPTPISNPSPEPPRTEPVRVALAEPQQVAAVSVYDSPDSAGPVVRATSRSDTPGLALLQAMAPERAGWTTEAQPTLYWHASQGTRFPCEFKLVREGEDEPLVRVQLPAPDAAGFQRIELSQFGVSLDEGASYRWSVSFVDLEHSGADRAIGGIRRVAPPETVRAITNAGPGPERLDALERAGLWYDALDLVTRSIERNPGAENLVARRNAMLARAGIQLPSS